MPLFQTKNLKIMKYSIQLLFMLLFSSYLIACSESEVNTEKHPDKITIMSEGYFPESFVFDTSEDVFYVGSIRKGMVVKVDLEGNIENFVENDALKSILGMVINKSTNQLLVCNSDPGFSEKTTGQSPPVLANVVAYDLTSGNEVANYDLSTLLPTGTPLLVNDIVLDDAGNAYITNSLAPVVFKISKEGEMSVFISNDSWAPTPDSFGLNGIEYHEDGFLIVAQYNAGSIYKVPLDDPSNFSVITIDKGIHSVDGIRLIDNENLIWVSNVLDPSTGIDNIIYLVKSTDNWISSKVTNDVVVGTGNEFPTTIGLVDGNPYVIYSHLTDLMAGNATVSEFEIKEVVFN